MRKTNPADVNMDHLRELGYERSDVSLPTLIKWLIFLFVFAAFCSLTSWVIYQVFVPEIGEDIRANPQKLVKMPPENPELQAAPKRDIREFRLAEERVLNTYGWADKSAGTVHVPIDVAMQTVAAHGLPPREAGPVPGAAVQPSPNLTGGMQIGPGETGSTLPPNQPNFPATPGPGVGENPAAPQGPAVGGGTTPNNGKQPGDQPGAAGAFRNNEGNAAGVPAPNANKPSNPNSPR
jgi:hypothetical protein